MSSASCLARAPLRPSYSQKKGLLPTAEDYRARFYETYRHEAEEYDQEFTKKHDEDLNTTLIFVRLLYCSDGRVLIGRQAGLFSAVTSAFIIEVNSDLKPDPNEETAALLRVLIHKMDNTTFGGDVPAVPQWTGPPRMAVHVQAMLFASLAASLLSAFLAMLGKQWLNRYASVDMRGSAIERSQNRQRKLDGIIAWYFGHVMQSLPLMLQAALLLLGLALSLYLWEIDTTVASVVVGVTSFGVLIYLFIIVAGAVYTSCPYQTPGAHILRRFLYWIHHTPDALHSVFSTVVKNSLCCFVVSSAWDELTSSHVTTAQTITTLLATLLSPIWLMVDVYRATRPLLVILSYRLYLWSRQASAPPAATLDLHCISWTLRTSLDAPVRLPTLNYLAITTLADFDLALVADCFDILISYVKVINEQAVVTEGMKQLAPATALCCLHTLSHLTVMDPMLKTLGSIRQRYVRAFPPETDFNTIPFSHIFGAIHRILYSDCWFTHWQFPQWEDYNPSSGEHVVVAHALVKISQSRCRMWPHKTRNVPCWLLRFALHSLFLSPLPSTPVIVNCLTIIAIDLGCDPPNTTTLGERCVRT